MNISASELREHLRAAAARFSSKGRKLNEGAHRVLHKLETVPTAAGLHRAYVKNGGSVVMWDLISDDELLRRGFVQTRHSACHILADEMVKYDRVTCWISEREASDELWIGEALMA
jgi:hypothetical protein